MKTQYNINRSNNPVTTTREPETEIIKGVSDTINIDAIRENALNNTDAARTTPADSYGVLRSGHQYNKQHIKIEEEGNNPLIDGI